MAPYSERAPEKQNRHLGLQLGLINFLHNSLCIIPNENLIANIGFGLGATHTLDSAARFANIPLGAITAITHPKHFIPNKNADFLTLDEEFHVTETRLKHIQQALKYNRRKYRFKRWLATHGGPQRWLDAGG